MKDRLATNSNRLAVFAASLRCIDEVKLVSMRTPRTWGIWRLASAAQKDRERGGRFPTVRHAYLLGLIDRSHSSVQVQAGESEERKRLD